jgi:hypothetical protein
MAKFSLDEVLKNNKKFLTFSGILALIFVYGPKAFFSYVGDLAVLAVEKSVTFLENALAVILNVSADLRPVVRDWLRRLARVCRRWFWRSVIITIVYLVLVTVGVMFEFSFLIAFAGIAAGLYFYLLSYAVETALVAAGTAYRFGESAVSAVARLPKAALEKLGFSLGGSGQPVIDRAELRRKLKDIRFLAVPYTAFAFWLALFPSWSLYGFAFVVLVGALSLTVISLWKEWESNVWRYYHWVSKWALITAIICFGLSAAFPDAWRGMGTFLKNKTVSAVAWLNTPKAVPASAIVVPVPAVLPAPVQSKTVPAPAPVAPRAVSVPRVVIEPDPPAPSQPLPAPDATSSDDDALAEAAEAAMKAKAEALKSGEPVVTVNPPPAKNPAINRRDNRGRLTPPPPPGGGRVRVIRIPKWVE